MKHTWKNSEGKEFQIKPVPPFVEAFIREQVYSKYELPKPPTYKVVIETPKGGEEFQYYEHSDDTMTEPAKEGDSNIISGWRGSKGELLRWQDITTASERRAWAGYKTKLAKLDAEASAIFAVKVTNELIKGGLVFEIPTEWRDNYIANGGKPDSITMDYVLENICTHDDDINSLIIAITEIRNISQDRVNAIKQNFRKAKEPSPTSETA